MKFKRDELEKLYGTMSLDEMAIYLKISKSTLFYHMRKLGIKRRSKKDAQINHLKKSSHQRTGEKHSQDSLEKISDGARRFWDSLDGSKQKNKLGKLRKQEWDRLSVRQKSECLKRLNTDRPLPGNLSKFGTKLFQFLEQRESVERGIKLTSDHVSDIILGNRKVVIELLLPISIYGSKASMELEKRYVNITKELNDLGYRVVIIEDKSNSLSNARCQRIYTQLLDFFTDTKTHLKIIS